MAAEFYDLSHPLRRELHRLFIRHSLEALADEPNVIHVIGDEYSGPLNFMQFWVDVVAEWEKETGKHPLIGLSACKDVQDAILADSKRAAIIDVIDFKYWFRTDSGEEFAPKGGTDLAPRQHQRLWKNGHASAASIASMVAEYRARFPEKAIISDLDGADGWAFVAAGGSLAKLPRTSDPRLLAALTKMKASACDLKGQWQLALGDAQFFIYSIKNSSVSLDLRATPGSFVVRTIELSTGAIASEYTLSGGKIVSLENPGKKAAAFWISRAP
jgi:hypothetical protein